MNRIYRLRSDNNQRSHPPLPRISRSTILLFIAIVVLFLVNAAATTFAIFEPAFKTIRSKEMFASSERRKWAFALTYIELALGAFQLGCC